MLSSGRPQFLVALATVLAMLAGLAGYVGSYYCLSRRGMREAGPYGLTGFFYLPYNQVIDDRSFSRHKTLARLYAPLNWVDQTCFGADGPVGGITWGFSKD